MARPLHIAPAGLLGGVKTMKKTILFLVAGFLAAGCGSEKSLENGSWKSGWTSTNLQERVTTCTNGLKKEYPSTDSSEITTLCTCLANALAERVTYDELKAGSVSQSVKEEIVAVCSKGTK
jgi:hypothetical protein